MARNLESLDPIGTAIIAYKAGDFKKAFRVIAKVKFKTAMSKDEIKAIAVASEMMGGNDRFWLQMGFTLEGAMEKAHEVFKAKILPREGQ